MSVQAQFLAKRWAEWSAHHPGCTEAHYNAFMAGAFCACDQMTRVADVEDDELADEIIDAMYAEVREWGDTQERNRP